MNETKEAWWSERSSFEAVQQLTHSCSVLIRPSITTQPSNLSISLQPSPFPRGQFELVNRLQTSFNLILDSVSRDNDFLLDTFEKIAKVDDFLKGFFHIYKTVMKQGYKERATLGLHRFDYMLDYSSSSSQLGIRQVEMNTMASSLGPLAEKLTIVHRYVTSRYSSQLPNSQLPDNPAIDGLCDGMATAWKVYNSNSAQILFVVAEKEKNIYDHRLIEYNLWNKHCIKVFRKTLTEISVEGKLDSQRRLFIDGVEVAIVYYRAGYAPEHFPTQKEWDARLMCELSCASNCPNLPYLFVGFKKVQQLLASKEVLERYCKDPQLVKDIMQVFAGQYSLDLTPEGDDTAKLGIEQPEKFVMKPQREGGGNNIYGEDVRTTLRELGSSQQREEYILMERIHPPAIPGVIWWHGTNHVTTHPVINELGIFGIFVRSGENVLLNTNGGHIIKTKSPSTDEGGVGYGASVLDTPLLIPDDQYIEYVKKCKSQFE